MHGRVLLPLAALLALALPATPAAAHRIALTADDSGSTVRAHVGDRITIALDANETTGYRWSVTTAPKPAVARVTRDRYVAQETGMAGSGGTQRYTIRVRGTGRTTFAATYAQVGSGDVGQRFRIVIRARR
ncbi:MAG: protease inhibitor I42 family protein [Solirubrobacteraceae bacterium]|nr:protease inhibitor I42 family protein [Solirubrobacteraceae bacterium]